MQGMAMLRVVARSALLDTGPRAFTTAARQWLS